MKTIITFLFFAWTLQVSAQSIFGQSTSDVGVYGLSFNDFGVQGHSTGNYGILGTSEHRSGGYFRGDDGVAIELGGVDSEWGEDADDCVIRTDEFYAGSDLILE